MLDQTPLVRLIVDLLYYIIDYTCKKSREKVSTKVQKTEWNQASKQTDKLTRPILPATRSVSNAPESLR